MNTPATPSAPLAAELHPAPAAPPVLDIVARIAECAPELREAERKVAAFILADLARAAHASIGALARDAEVSVATVTRFAKAVGCRDEHLQFASRKRSSSASAVEPPPCPYT